MHALHMPTKAFSGADPPLPPRGEWFSALSATICDWFYSIPHSTFFPFVFKMEATSIYQIHQEMQDSEWRIAISNGKQNADVPFPFPQACFLVYWICFSLFFVPCGGIDWFLQQWYGRVRWSENIRVKKRYTADAIENMWPKTLNAILWKLFFLSLTSY